mmetsp:Transcript_30248/g.83454  ORF Transcript_30248/g.83454 Transcript_30248/m.83454 type:complete len:303 (-) Transcript_30248:433-1341(-)
MLTWRRASSSLRLHSTASSRARSISSGVLLRGWKLPPCSRFPLTLMQTLHALLLVSQFTPFMPLCRRACTTLIFPCRTRSLRKATAARRASASASSWGFPGATYRSTGNCLPLRLRSSRHRTLQHLCGPSHVTPGTPLCLLCVLTLRLAALRGSLAALGAAAAPADSHCLAARSAGAAAPPGLGIGGGLSRHPLGHALSLRDSCCARFCFPTLPFTCLVPTLALLFCFDASAFVALRRACSFAMAGSKPPFAPSPLAAMTSFTSAEHFFIDVLYGLSFFCASSSLCRREEYSESASFWTDSV